MLLSVHKAKWLTVSFMTALTFQLTTILLPLPLLAQTTTSNQRFTEASNLLLWGVLKFNDNPQAATELLRQSFEKYQLIHQNPGIDLEDGTFPFGAPSSGPPFLSTIDASGSERAQRAQLLQDQLEFYQQLLAIYQLIGDRSAESETWEALAVYYRNNRDQSQLSNESHQRAIALYQAMGDRQAEARSLLSTALSQFYDSPQAATELLRQSFAIYQHIRQSSGIDLEDGTLFGSPVVVGTYGSEPLLQAQLVFFLQLLDLYQLVGDRSGETDTRENLALQYQYLAVNYRFDGQLQKAADAYRRAIAIYQTLGDQEAEDDVSLELDNLYLNQN